MMRRGFPLEACRFPDTLQKVVIDVFSRRSEMGLEDTVRTLFGTGVHSKDVGFAFREWKEKDDPKLWENSWMERVVGSRGPW